MGGRWALPNAATQRGWPSFTLTPPAARAWSALLTSRFWLTWESGSSPPTGLDTDCPIRNRSASCWTGLMTSASSPITLTSTSSTVMGWSAGGAPALACATRLPERVLAAAIGQRRLAAGLSRAVQGTALCQPAVEVRGASNAGAGPPHAADGLSPHHGRPRRCRQDHVDDLPAGGPAPARRSGGSEEVRAGYPGRVPAGLGGAGQDDIVNAQPWGFRLEDVAQRVDIWQGEIDENIRLHHAHCLHERLPNSRLTVWEGEAHLALLTRWSEVLAALVG